ncbi:YkgJ family cysteine cluster protein [Azospirillum sp.]|uniref:YkgJ family cysteine cluster protein n=1 Tax=Azospirillum sp. TaxID=34012 RepID=UPI003D70D961
MASLCDTCIRPGACCFGFELGARTHRQIGLELLAMVARQWMPFVPLYRRDNGFWRWWCPLLGADGRCTDYANRPETCRIYDPGEDFLCVHHVEPKGCMTLLKDRAA